MVPCEADRLLKKAFDELSGRAITRDWSQDLLLEMASYLRTKGISVYARYPPGPRFTLIPADTATNVKKEDHV